MAKGKLVGDRAEQALVGLMEQGLESVRSGGTLNRISGLIIPVEITVDWTKEAGKPYFCKAKQLIYDDAGYKRKTTDFEFTVFDPMSKDQKPTTSVGNCLTIVNRGQWEVVGSPGEMSSEEHITTVTAIITNASPGRVDALGNELVYAEMLNDFQVAPIGIKVLVGKIGGKWQIKETTNLTYQLISPAPVMSINATAQTVTMSTPYTTARIAGTIYKHDGSTLSTFSNQTSPYSVRLDEAGWVAAYTTSNNLIDSPVVTRNIGLAATPILTFDPTTRRLTAELPFTESGTTISITITWSDGSTPTVYTGRSSGWNITLTKSATVSAWSVHSGWMNSAIVTKFCEVS